MTTHELIERSPALVVTFAKCQWCTFLSHSSTSKDWLCVLQWGECPRIVFDRRLAEDKLLKIKRRYRQKPLL